MTMEDQKRIDAKRFDAEWEKWRKSGTGIGATMFVDMEFLRAVAGYFYFSGASDATQEAREIVKGAR